MARKLAICHGRVVTPSGEAIADVIVDGDRVEAVQPVAETHGGCTVIDATGRIVLPGSVDAHVHVGIPYILLDGTIVHSVDRFPQASAAAAAGGTTTIIDFAMQSPGEDLLGPLQRRRGEVELSNVDVALHCWVMEASETVLAQVADLVDAGVPSLKAFMAYSQLGEPMDDGSLYALFEAVAASGGLIALHAENAGVNARQIRRAQETGRISYADYPGSRPAVGEEEAVCRALVFGAASGAATYFVHLSTAGAVRRLRRARRDGQHAFGETCPHFLYFDESVYRSERAGDFMMAPPLRTTADQAALHNGIEDRVIDVVATDHTSWPRALKNRGRGFPGAIQGVAGLGLLTPLLAGAAASGEISWTTVARVTAAAPAEIFGLAYRKGTIRAGADADLLLLDPARIERVAATPPYWSVDNCIYDQLPAIYPDAVFRRGELIAERGRYLGPEAGSAQFVRGELPSPPSSGPPRAV
ncbi:MAG: dihydroorotase [Solirubrobacteraceae bacterium]